MVHGENWVVQEHARTCVPHDFFHFLSHFRRVTVHQALGAGAFFLLERTLVQPHRGVLKKRAAFRAELAFGTVLVLAVNVNHGFNGFFLSRDSRVLINHPTSHCSFKGKT